MRFGILGFSQSGKTTVFNALTGAAVPVGRALGAGKVEVHERLAEIPDRRLEALSDLLRPRKVTHAQVAVVDIDGLRVEAHGRGLSGGLGDHLGKADALLAVVRDFADPAVAHPQGGIEPLRDLQRLEDELLLHDLLAAERRQGRLVEERQKGARERAAIERDQALFEKLHAGLHAGQPLRELSLSAEEEHSLAGFVLLTRKPILVLANRGEGPAGEFDLPQRPGRVGLPFSGKLEMEIAQLPADEAPAFLEGYGLKDPGRNRVLGACLDLLGLNSFFTVNEQEGKAWLVRRGGTALEAAGTIHSDLARGFVRAEIIAWDELIQAGGLPQAKAHGLLRVHGKDHPVADGDFVLIRSGV